MQKFFKNSGGGENTTPNTRSGKTKPAKDESLTLKDFMPKAKTVQTNLPVDFQLDARARAEAKANEVGSKHRQQSDTGETGGPQGLDPTRYGDWERAGRCIDF